MRTFFYILLLVICPLIVNATDFIWDGSQGTTTWTDPLNWTAGSGYPDGIDDTATFNAIDNQSATIPANTSIGELTITSSYSGTVTLGGNFSLDSSSTGNGNFTISTSGGGSFTASTFRMTVSGDVSISNGTFTSTSGSLIVSGDFSHTGGTFTHNSGTVLFRNAVSVDRTLTLSGNPIFNNVIMGESLMVGYWKLDEASSPAIDSSGNGNNATWNGGFSSSVSTPIVNFTNTRSVTFDSVDDYVDAPNFSMSANSDITIAFWNYVATAASTAAFGIGGQGVGERCMSHAPWSDGNIYWDYGVYPGNGRISTSYAAYVGKWTHVTLVSKGSTGTFNAIYLDGVLATSSTVSDSPDSAITGLNIGRSQAGFNHNGTIDDFRIYSRVLSGNEIADLAAGNAPEGYQRNSTLSGNFDVNGDLTLNTGTLTATSNDINLAGNWVNNGATFIAGTSVVTMDGAAEQLVTGTTTFSSFHHASSKHTAFQGNTTFSTRLIVESGAVTAGLVTLTFGNNADFRVGEGTTSPAIVSFDGTIVTTDSSTSVEKFTMSIRQGGDIHAKTWTRFNYLNNGIVFHTGSRMGSNNSGTLGRDNFRRVSFDNVDNAEYGLDFTNLVSGDADNFSDNTFDIFFNEIPAATTAKNVNASVGTPAFNFYYSNSVYDYGTVATDGVSGETDPGFVISWLGLLDLKIFIWDGSQGTTDWTDPLNWTAGSGYPAVNDSTALFNATGSQNATVPASLKIGAITIDNGYSGTVTLGGSVTLDNSNGLSGDLSVAAGAFSGSSYAMNILGDVSVTGGTFTATSGLLTVSGDFTHSGGTFTHNSGVVMFGGLSTTSDRTITLSASTVFNDVVINDGLVAHWKLDETGGTTSVDSGPYGYNGTWSGDPTSSTDLPSVNFYNPRSLDFDGTGDYVTVPNTATELDLTTKLTLSAWVNYTSTGSRGIIDKTIGGTTNKQYMLFSEGRFKFKLFASATSMIIQSNSVPTADQWYHVAGTWDGSTMKMYVNGTLQSDTDPLSAPLDSGVGTTLVGTLGSGIYNMNGKIDDVRIYNRALTQSEVTALSSGNAPGFNLTTTTVSTGNLDVNGDLILHSGELSVGSNHIEIAQNWNNYGGVFTPGTGTVTFDGTGATYNLISGGQAFNNLNVHDGGGSAVTVSILENLDVNGNLGILDGALTDTTGVTIGLAGNFVSYPSGTFTATAGIVTTDGASKQIFNLDGITTFNNFHQAGTHTYFKSNGKITFSNRLIVETGVFQAWQTTFTMGSGANFHVSPLASPAVVTLDACTVTTDSTTTIEKWNMVIYAGGDVHATGLTSFNYLNDGIIFHTGSRMGSNTSGSDGAVNFTDVNFVNIASGEWGLNFVFIESGDNNNFPASLTDIRFVSIDGATGSFNVSADAATPLFTFNVDAGNYGSIATDGESGDSDASARITWSASGTWVSLSEFKALGDKTKDGVDINWTTTTEFQNQGFNLYRSFERHGDYVKVNKNLILPPEGQSLNGHTYLARDALPKRGLLVFYKLEDIDSKGKKTLHGPISVDWDRDGLPDDWEHANGLSNSDANDAHLDSDGDGLSNLEEYKYGLDPQSNDSDEDGILDGNENLNIWNGPIIHGINAGGKGLTIIGQDPFGITFELNVKDILKEKVSHRYSAFAKASADKSGSDKGKPVRRSFSAGGYKQEDFYALRFAEMPSEYLTQSGIPNLPLKRVLLNIPKDRTIETKIIKEEWSSVTKLDRLVEPVPTFEERPVKKAKWIKELIKHKQWRTVTKGKESRTFKSNHKRNAYAWSALAGGKKHKEKYYETREEYIEEQNRNKQFDEEVYGTPDGKIVEIYAKNKTVYSATGFAPESHFTASKPAYVGNQLVTLLGVNPVKYDPVTGELKFIKKLRFRVNYIYDPKVLQGKTADWIKEYDALNANKPEYLNHEEAIEIKIKKPAYSTDGDLNDKTLIKLKWTDLTTAGVNWQNNPSMLHIYQGIHQLSLKEVADGVIFYVDRGLNETLYNDKLTVYAIQHPYTPGNRWITVESELNSNQTLTQFDQTIRVEKNNFSLYMNFSPNTFFVNAANVLTSKNGNYSVNYGFNTPGISPLGTVQLNARMYPLYNFAQEIDGEVKLTLNSEANHYSHHSWPGHQFYLDSNMLNANLFVDGANNLKITAYKPTGIPYNRIFLDYMEVIYPRTLKAYQEKLLINHKLETGVTNVKVTAFTNPVNIVVLDVTDPTQIKQITGATNGQDFVEVNIFGSELNSKITLADNIKVDSDKATTDPKWTKSDEGKTKLLFIDLSNIANIASATKVTGNTSIRGRKTALDHMIVVDETLKTKAEELVDHLTTNGQVVELVSYQDLRKEYTSGEYATAAIHDYVKERWKTAPVSQKPKYLTIIGSGNFNTKGLWNFPSEKALIPSVMLRNSKSMKGSAADWEYAKITDDIYPDISVGRLDCGTETELENIINKIKNYENTQPTKSPKALLVTDHDPTFDLYLFNGYMDKTLKSFEAPWTYSKIYRTNSTPAAMTTSIINSLNSEQINLILYNGHGSFKQWGKDNFFNASHLNQLNAGHYLPVVIEANCISSDFYNVAFRSFGSQLLQKKEAGAIAVIGNTSMTKASSKTELFQSIVDNLLRRGFPEVGNALRRAKIESMVNSDQDNAIATMHLLGLPSLKMR